MSTIKPLAEVERMVTVAGGYGGVRIGGPKGPTWGVNGGLFDRQHDPPADAVAESLAHDINEAHWQTMAPLLALLAQARGALARVRDHHWREVHPGYQAFDVRFGPEEKAAIAAVVAALDAANPGEWVPAERLKECQAVLADLREEKADMWRGRCERALTVLREGQLEQQDAWVLGRLIDSAKATLEGREAELPEHRRVTPYGLGYVEHEESEP